MHRNLKMLLAAAVVMTIVGLDAKAADEIYMRSTVGLPWGVTKNEAAMDDVFGVAGWTQEFYETAVPGTLFSAVNSLIFMEGGDSNADELEAFLTANNGSIEAWVNAGGRLLIQSAPNEGDGMAYPFGVTLTYPDFGGAASATLDGGHPIFSGPFQPMTTIYTGNFFSHASAAVLSPIIEDGDGDTVLGEMTAGSGLFLAGGMTTDNFHDPDPESANLTRNILHYLANADLGPAPIPEPATIVLAAIGGLGLVGSRMRRRKSAQ